MTFSCDTKHSYFFLLFGQAISLLVTLKTNILSILVFFFFFFWKRVFFFSDKKQPFFSILKKKKKGLKELFLRVYFIYSNLFISIKIWKTLKYSNR